MKRFLDFKIAVIKTKRLVKEILQLTSMYSWWEVYNHLHFMHSCNMMILDLQHTNLSPWFGRQPESWNLFILKAMSGSVMGCNIFKNQLDRCFWKLDIDLIWSWKKHILYIWCTIFAITMRNNLENSRNSKNLSVCKLLCSVYCCYYFLGLRLLNL